MKQAEKVYLISDAAKQVQVEAHVLRYWEEELQLPIKRNELGHRYYTEEDITRFREIRRLKEEGLQLKAIRTVLTKGGLQKTEVPEAGEAGGKEEEKEENTGIMKRQVVMVNKGEFVPVTEESREAKSLRLQQLLENMIREAVRSNNREVCDEIKDNVLKELDYQFRLQEERETEREKGRISREEEHYRALDELLRTRSGRKSFEERTARHEMGKNKEERKERGEEMKEGELFEKRTKQKAESAEKKKRGFLLKKKRSIG